MNYYLQSFVYISSFLFPLILGLNRFRILDNSSRFIVALVITSFLGEVIALVSAVKYNNNLWVYNVVQILMTIILCFYFNNCIEFFSRRKIGVYVALISILVWISSLVFMHSIFSINSIYLAYMGTVTIIMSIISMDNLIVQKRDSLFRILYSPHFWFAWILLIYWCFSLIQWMIYKFYTNQTVDFKYIELSLTIITMMVNLGYAFVLLYYPKMLSKNAA